ncbi:hypothetical protein [Sphingobacterium tabacisoli]|uniref:PepSY domain-containing protein n=1 Tax=Sphingobacterium tabacisoli TaxID=2044855 RepID=A0ABW5L7T8_9SPHI|nr:hypothetical protein [Sphingobacterium tabacisoli]
MDSKAYKDGKDKSTQKEISKKDIMSILALKNIRIKDKKYAEEHLTFEQKSEKTSFEVKVTDIDGQIHMFHLELKRYK